MRTIAIIPARGGSKGIPKKNLEIVNGKPLVVHSINAAMNAKSVDMVYVSTDDNKIAQVSKDNGASVILRPKNISGDNASSESALLHLLGSIEKKEGIKPQFLVFLQCTSPLTTSDDIDKTVHLLIKKKADSALSVTDFHYFLWKRNKNGNSTGINHNKAKRFLRQNKDKQYLENGAIYIMRAEGFKKYKHRFFGKTVIYEMPPERSLEIDDPIDLKLAETLIRYNDNKNNILRLPKNITGVAFDFDGVFTDNKVFLSENGVESVRCDRSDGMGIELLNKLKIPLTVISSEKNKVVRERCKKLNINVEHGVKNKLKNLRDWVKINKIDKDGLIYVGNDINDIECLQFAGCGICVADSHPDAKIHAEIILSNNGGNGAVRELSDLIRKKLKNE